MEKRTQQFEVVCLTHGTLGIITQAHLGLSLFDTHRKEFDGCRGAEIKPITEEVEELPNRLSCDKGAHRLRSLANQSNHAKHKFK